MIFRNIWVLSLIPLFLLAFYFVRRERRGFIFPTDEIVGKTGGGLKILLIRNAVYLRVACIVLVLIALARPQVNMERDVKKEGIAIVLAIDCSSTMLAQDIKLSFQELAEIGGGGKGSNVINRIDAVRYVAEDFVAARTDDVIGIVAFASQAYIVCPPTFDHEWLRRSLQRVKVGLIKDGTAIGSSILSSLNSLREVDAKSKIIILLTDGINNFGKVPPLVAAKAARAMGIKIYTIGVLSGTGGVNVSSDGSGRRSFRKFTAPIDEDELKEISAITGGEYFPASDMKSLRENYKKIDKLEKVSIEQKGFEEYADVFQRFLIPALILLLVDIVLRNTYLRRIP